jgi:hypothetical protein
MAIEVVAVFKREDQQGDEPVGPEFLCEAGKEEEPDGGHFGTCRG